MLLIPEIKTVVILVPRTGSGTLRRAVKERYPQAIQLYRHMEADGVPIGYDRWRKVGVVRNPVDRLWSLYKFMRDMDGPHDAAYMDSMRKSASVPFSDWIVNNNIPFTTPYDTSMRGRYFAEYAVRHPLPENKKSQYLYLRPDLGTKIYNFDSLGALEVDLDVDLSARHNKTASSHAPKLSTEAWEHIQLAFKWDLQRCSGVRRNELA